MFKQKKKKHLVKRWLDKTTTRMRLGKGRRDATLFATKLLRRRLVTPAWHSTFLKNTIAAR